MNNINTQKRATQLTEVQKEIIRENTGKFDSDIVRLPGMEGTTPRQVGDYRKKITRPSESDHRRLADQLAKYIQDHGLPARFGDVIPYIQYLRERG